MRYFFTLISVMLLLVSCNQLKQTKQVASKNSIEKQPVVVQFIIDGLMKDAAETAIKAGAENLKYLAENGVVVQDAYSNSPVGRVKLPDGSEPWGGASPPNIGMHTGSESIAMSNGKASIEVVPNKMDNTIKIMVLNQSFKGTYMTINN